MSKFTRALLSVSDKTGLAEFSRVLARAGIELLASGGTAKALAAAGVPVREVSDFTGAPEILDGRVKTLHPRIHGGLLGRPTAKHREEMQKGGLSPINLAVVNLYPFRETVARGAPFEDIIENIDIGGPAMIRSAAKNHERVAVVVDPADYARVAAEIEATGEVSAALRFELACKAFAHTAAYDGAIASYLTRLESPEAAPVEFAKSAHWSADLVRTLRYGENPHQKAAFYALPGVTGLSLPRAEVLQGKELSYNNILDLDAAMRLGAEFAPPAVAIIKHTNPCGCAVSDTDALDAYRRARETDPVSAFGGIVAVNRVVDGALGRELSETFLECVIAPGYAPEALAVLAGKKGLRLLTYDFIEAAARERAGAGAHEVRSVSGGFLVQTRDMTTAAAASGKVVTKRAPTAAELADLDFAWRVSKHVKSNAIVFAGAGRTLGVGAGQMSRVDSVRIAVSKARVSLQGSVLASDAFFPFRDGVDEAAKAGVSAIVEPGGSVRDEEVIAAADEHGIAMIFTGERHFRRWTDQGTKKMPKILLIGGGGREHALAWKLGQSPRCEEIIAAPGNPGIATLPKVRVEAKIAVDDAAAIVALARVAAVDLVVCGPEGPLCAGLGDAVRAAGIPFFGPSGAAAEIEGSKAFAKRVMAEAGVPTAAFGVFDDVAGASGFIDAQPGPVVVKADGLCAGKGVVVADTKDESKAAVRRMLGDREFGAAGARVVLEERLFGREVSMMAFCDGADVALLAAAEDHKAVFDGDRGPNTGGMGTYSPSPLVDDALAQDIVARIFRPTVAALNGMGRPFRGLLYAGLMLTPDRGPMVIEWNCRFGDPETQVVLMRMEDDLLPWLEGAARGRLPAGAPRFAPGAAVCVVLAAANYPGPPRTGDPIAGLDDGRAVGVDRAAGGGHARVWAFHAGTRRDGDRLVTAGGRVLGITARGADLAAARARAYGSIGTGPAQIGFPGMHFRHDIGMRGER